MKVKIQNHKQKVVVAGTEHGKKIGLIPHNIRLRQRVLADLKAKAEAKAKKEKK